jgi:hypothetical protein
MYYFLLNKQNMATLIAQYAWAVQTDGTLTEDPTLVTRDPERAQDWGTEDPVWTSDQSDPATVKATETAEKVIKSRSYSTTSLPFLTIDIQCIQAADYLRMIGTPAALNLAPQFEIIAAEYLAGGITLKTAIDRYSTLITLHRSAFAGS